MKPLCTFLLLVLLAAAGALPKSASADAALPSRLGLDNQQAAQFAQLDAEHRRAFAALRQEFNREARALRRARLAHDSSGIERLTAVTESLRGQLAAMRQAHDERIAALLRPEQVPRFEAYLAERRQMHGSARDERMFD